MNNILILKNDDKDSFISKGKLIFKKFEIINLIGKGSFGKVYSVLNKRNNNLYAMKTENLNSKEKALQSEAYYLLLLKGFGIPEFISYGCYRDYNILIEELLDKSLDYIYIKTGANCDLNDACLIAIQLLDRLQWIHSKDLIYRDVKPQNFLIGKKDPNVIYVIDFGLCKKYRSSKKRKHIIPKLTGKFSGTMKYASPNALRGKEQSRRDDLLSLGYMIIYLKKKNLPWKYEDNYFNYQKFIKLIHDKESDANGSLFYDLPLEFKEYIYYTKHLKFEEEPDYDYLRGLFKQVLIKNNSNIDMLKFHWAIPENKNLIGLPKNMFYRKSNSKKRLLKNIEELSCKRIREQRTPDIPRTRIQNDFMIPSSQISKNLINTLEANNDNNNYTKSDLNEENNIKKINMKKLNPYSNLNIINSNSNNINNRKKKRNIKAIYVRKNLYNNYEPHSPNNSPDSKIINFNKSNILNVNNSTKKININKMQISPLKKLKIENPQYYSKPQYYTFGKSEENSFGQMSSLNIKKNYGPIKKKLKNFTYANTSRNISPVNNKINLGNLYSYCGNSNTNNTIYNPTTQNVGIMIINNYKDKEPKNKLNNRVLINKKNNMRIIHLAKKNSTSFLPKKYQYRDLNFP